MYLTPLSKYNGKVLKNRLKIYLNPQTILAMKLLPILLFIACIQAGATGYSQGITISGKDIPLKQVFQDIRQQSGYLFFYSDKDLKRAHNVDLETKNAELEAVLLKIFKEQPLTYNIIGKTIVVKSAPSKINARKFYENLISSELNEPLRVISGRVTDEDGNPLQGVSVTVKGTQIGVATDNRGNFSINVELNQVLIFSYTGMKTEEIKITDLSKSLNVVLTLKDAAMEDVVVMGVRTVKQESFTGAATTVSGEDLRRVGNQNIFQSLKNLDPTVFIMENMSMGSNPNALPDMNIRGGTSFSEALGDPDLKGNYQNKPNQPLFILDGFEASVERIFDLDMNTVQSLTILRDASAKALYGSRAANGVVVIETRSLLSNKPRISYAGSLDLTMPDLSSYKLLDAEQKLDVEFRENVYPVTNPTAFDNYNKLRKQVLEGLNTYWLSKPVQVGYGQKHSVNVDLGKDELRTQINLSMLDNVGVMKGSGRKTLSAGFNLLYRLNRVKFQNRLSIVNNKSDDSPYGSFRTYTILNPYLNPYDDFGNIIPVMNPGNVRNPLSDGTIPTSLKAGYVDITNNFEAEYNVFTGLRIRARLSTTLKKNDASRYYPVTHTRFANYANNIAYRKGQYETNNGSNDRLSGDLYVNYNKTIDKKHNFFFTGGFNLIQNKFREVINYTEGFPSVNMNDIMFAYQYNEVLKRPSGVTGINREVGLLSMLSYTYDDRFLFDGTFRLNGSSIFGNKNRFAPFWSLGLGWNIHNEETFKDLSQIKILKVRGSLGSTGNQNFLNNKSITVNNYYLSDRYAGLVGSYAANMENPELKWEQKMDYNVGLDADIYNISIKFDIYRTITENLVTNATTAPSTGFLNVSENLGKVENKGIEVMVAYTLFQNRKGFFRINGSYVNNKNTILKISDAMRSFNDRQLAFIHERTDIAAKAMPPVMFYDGLPMNTIWAVPSYGIDPATGIELLKGADGLGTYIWKASDMVPSGISVPKWRGTFGMNGEYKGVGLFVAFTYLGGGQYYNSTLVNKIENIQITQNFDQRVLTERWSDPGQEAQYKSLAGRTPYDMRNGIYWYSATGWSQEATRPTQRFVQNQNELNLSSIVLSYDFNRKWLSSFKMERLRCEIYMNDIAKFSTIGIERGTDYPFARTISFKLTATF